MKKLALFSVLLFISPTVLAYSCDTTRPYCKDMQSCEQAKFYLNQCGVSKLDRDGDGIPCENICGKKGKSNKKEKSKNSNKLKKSKRTKSK